MRPGNPQWQAKGDPAPQIQVPGHRQKGYPLPPLRSHNLGTAKAKLPLVLMLHGGGANESQYLDMNGGQLLQLAEQHGYILLSPLGYSPLGAYGTPLRLPVVFGQPNVAAQQRAAVDPDKERGLEYSEKDVINVLEIVLNEYPVDRGSVFLTGHSMGSGGAWYLGAKYAEYWAAMAPMSGPFVDEANYPWERLRRMPIFMTEGTGATPSVAGNHPMRDRMKARHSRWIKEDEADHGGIIRLVAARRVRSHRPPSGEVARLRSWCIWTPCHLEPAGSGQRSDPKGQLSAATTISRVTGAGRAAAGAASR